MIRNPAIWRTNATFLYVMGCLCLFGGPITIAGTGLLLERLLPGLESEAFHSCICYAIFQIVLAGYFLLAAATFVERIPVTHGNDDSYPNGYGSIDDIEFSYP